MVSETYSMEISITKKDVFWGYIAQLFNVGASSLFLLPLIVILLPTEIFGMWGIFQMLSGIMLMLDLGFQPTFGRNVAYIFGGATTLMAEGTAKDSPTLDCPNYPLLKNMIATMRGFYLRVAGIAAFLLLTFGTWFVHVRSLEIPVEIAAGQHILPAWVIYVVSFVLNFYFSYYTALLIGRGLIKENNQLIIITRGTYIALAAVGLLNGYGILAVAVANLLSIMVGRTVAVRFFYKEGLRNTLKTFVKSNENLFPVIWFNAKKIALANIGGYYIQKGNAFLVSAFLPLTVMASYTFTVQILTVLATVSPLYLNAHLPEIFKNRIRHNREALKRIFGESLLIYYVIFISGALFILFFADPVIKLAGSQTAMIPFWPLLLLLTVQFFETNHTMATTFISTRNEIPFLKATLVSGLISFSVSCILMAFTPLGIYSVIIVPGIVQASYNNWKWPRMVCKELESNYPRLMRNGFITLKAWFFRHWFLTR